MAALTSMSAFAENNPNTPVIPQYPNVKVENQVHAGGKNETVYVEFGSNATTGLGKLFKTPISERWGKQICLNE